MMEGLDLPHTVVGDSLVGSTAIYGKGADIDYVVLVTDASDWLCLAIGAGWVMDGLYPGADFTSLRKGKYNLIVTQHTWLFEAYVLATECMKKLAHIVPQEDKPKRVKLYELIKDWSRP